MDEYVKIPKEYAMRMLHLFTDIEQTLDDNKSIVPDSNAAKGFGSNPPSNDQLAKDEYSIHQRVSWMASGYSGHICDHTDWFDTNENDTTKNDAFDAVRNAVDEAEAESLG
jgi:hypothetical protein